MKILLIEDEPKITDFVCQGLTARGLLVDHCDNGHAGFDAAKRGDGGEYGVIVLDIMLPGRDGLSVLKGLRSAGVKTPVILLTARNELDDRIEGLNLGADDYLAKPFFVEELLARIQALQRRAVGDGQNILQVGQFKLDRISRKASCGDKTIDLTTREFSLMEYLMRSAGQVFTRSQILEHVWGYDFDPSTNVVDVCIKRIRGKIASMENSADGRGDIDSNSLIESVRGAGYRFRQSI
jgi:two-component system, OmpR family, response regulator